MKPTSSTCPETILTVTEHPKFFIVSSNEKLEVIDWDLYCTVSGTLNELRSKYLTRLEEDGFRDFNDTLLTIQNQGYFIARNTWGDVWQAHAGQEANNNSWHRQEQQ